MTFMNPRGAELLVATGEIDSMRTPPAIMIGREDADSVAVESHDVSRCDHGTALHEA